MTFQTIPGAAGTDEPTRFNGSENADLLLSLNTVGSQIVTALGGADDITLENVAGVVGEATVKGGSGNDLIRIGVDAVGAAATTRLEKSSINGGAGDDVITLRGMQSSTARGNEGEDVITLDGNYTSSVINGGKGGDRITLNGAIQLEDTKILGGNDNDGAINLTSAVAITAVDSTVNGNVGNDTITIGGAGDITATGFTIFGGQGDDFINGTTLSAASDDITFSGDKGEDQITTGISDDLILGGDDNDIITSTSGDNTMDGGAGNDQITGGTDADSIDGGEGNDTIVDADAEDNTINGGAGNDTITSGTGDDEITGGAGSDTFIDTTGTYRGSTDFNIGIGDSNAAVTGTTTTFDVFADLFGASSTDIDLTTGLSNQLAGSNAASAGLAAAVTINIADAGTATDTTGMTFAELKAAVDANGLTASGATAITSYIINVAAQTTAATATTGIINATSFVLLNDPNTIMNSGDVMFEVQSAAEAALAIAAIDLN